MSQSLEWGWSGERVGGSAPIRTDGVAPTSAEAPSHPRNSRRRVLLYIAPAPVGFRSRCDEVQPITTDGSSGQGPDHSRRRVTGFTDHELDRRTDTEPVCLAARGERAGSRVQEPAAGIDGVERNRRLQVADLSDATIGARN